MQFRHVALCGIALSAALTLSAPAQAHNNGDAFSPVRDARGAPVRSMLSNQCVLTRWPGMEGECLGTYRHIALEDRTVYFEFNKAYLTPKAKAKLDSLTGILRNEKNIKSLSIVGYADRIGSRKYNAALSKKRALSVRAYLRSQGFNNVNVARIRWLGEDRPTTSCPGDLTRGELIACLQPDRRVEVEVNYEQTVLGGKKKTYYKKKR